MLDYIIIGSGIIGSLIARELSKYEVSVLVLDKENDIASHQTTANSAIIHSGHDPEKDTLKAKLCVAGNRLYEALEKELEIPLRRTGAYVVAHDRTEEIILDELYERALYNGVQDPHFISLEEAFRDEPNLSKSVTKVLSLPSTKVTYPWEVAIAAMSNAIENGASFKRSSEVVDITKSEDYFEVYLKKGDIIKTKHIINCAGVFSDQIAMMLEPDFPLTIQPRRGEYFVLDRKAKDVFNHVLYPIPTAAGKGVLIVPQVHGNVLLGPTSESITDKEHAATTRDGLKKIKDQLKKLSENIPYDMVIRSFAGIRASSNYHDFYIKESERFPGFFHVAGIDSPGLTAAPAIAEYLIKEVMHLSAPKKDNFDPIRHRPIVFHKLSEEDKQHLIKQKPAYGNLICKCEKITEQEIIDAIHGPVGSDTVKGIKKRARAGSGLCQGGYCESLVLKLIHRETSIPMTSINYDGEQTPILVKETKSDEKH